METELEWYSLRKTQENVKTEILPQKAVSESKGTLALVGIAAAVALLHLLTNHRYAIHRDEFQFLSDARHLEWGFVAYPPFTPFVERISMGLFGLWLPGLRLFSVLAQAIVIVISGLMARSLGGSRLAQAAAALSVALSPLPMFEGTEFQYTTFDYLWWVLIAYFVVRLLKEDDPRWWLAVGAAAGLGLLTKYTIFFDLAGILGGMLLTRARRYFLDPWFWAGTALALLVFLPNLVWQSHHGFISYHFLQYIHRRDVSIGRAEHYLRDQFLICANLFAVPLWMAGLLAFLRSARYRLLAWMYILPVGLLWVARGRGYYSGAAYPVLIAMGAVVAERWSASLPAFWRRTVRTVFFTGLAACGIYICLLVIPLASSGPLRNFVLAHNEDLREEIGWDQLVGTVAQVRDSLSPQQQSSLGVLTANYGEQGALEILGPSYHLQRPMGITNSAWLRGYPVPPPSTLIVVGFSREWVDKNLTGCRLAAQVPYPEGIQNEEGRYHRDIFVCGPPRKPWPEFWKEHQSFG